MTGGMEKHGRALSEGMSQPFHHKLTISYLTLCYVPCEENAENRPKEATGDEPKDDWVVVPEGMQNGGIEPSKSSSGYSGHWDLTLGWGKWKHTLVDFDWKFEHKHSRECQQSQVQPREAQEVGSKDQNVLEGEQKQ
ncbi:hypothetical protein LIA77_00266 [Sarocladium implicatum]|nr:hypothetical protein LIA77_00266 [Sarocladium implicatum]